MAKIFPASETISPSVRFVERDWSAYSPGFSLAKGAMVGFASKGEFNKPTLVRTRDELFRLFGWPRPEAGTYLIYAAMEFLRYGNQLYIVRVGDEEEGSETQATKAYVDIPSAGTQAQIFIPRFDPTDGITELYFDPAGGVDRKIRIKTNGQAATRILTLPGDELVPIVSADAEDVSVYTLLKAQEKADDPFTITQVVDSGDPGADGVYIKSKVNGADASIELVSVENDAYGHTALDNALANGGLNINTSATRAKAKGSITEWPVGDSNGGFNLGYLNTTLKLEIIVNGTGNSAIDGKSQVISIASDNYTLSGLIAELNKAANGRLGGWAARQGQQKFIVNAAAGGAIDGLWEAVADTSNGETAGTIVLETLHAGEDASITVRATTSTLAPYIGITPKNYKGTTADTADAGVDEFEGGKFHGTSTTNVTRTFTVWSSTTGTEGDEIDVTITRNGTSGTFNITVLFHGLPVETFVNLNKDNSDPDNVRYVETWINDLSFYIDVEDNTDTDEGPKAGTYSLVGGADGIPTDTSDQAALLVGNEFFSTGLYSLAEPEKIDIDLVAVPGVSTTSVILGMQDLCENLRCDCLGLVDPPRGMAPWEVIQWHNGQHPLNNVKLDTSYLALFWPWVKVRDTIHNDYIWLPPSGPVMGQFALNDSLAHPWYAAAGLRRGVMEQVIELEYQAYIKDRDTMYGFQNAVNTITKFPDSPHVIWGNKTLQRRQTSLDRINVRRLLFYIEKRIGANAKALLFEPHDDILRKRFKNIADTIMGFIRNSRGVHDYIVKCDETNNPDEVIDRNEMHAQIGIQPVKSAEFIMLTYTVHRKGTYEESEPII